jgi:hypothetical protein
MKRTINGVELEIGQGEDLRGADLRGAYLWVANLAGAYLPPLIVTLPAGPFRAWKQVQHGVILELEITGARTATLVGRKCRCSSARVISANAPGDVFGSLHDPDFTYTVGETVSVSDYSDDIRVECAPGIHFFATREEAVNY